MSVNKADSAQAATQLESYFLRRVLAEVRSSEQGLLDGGFAGGTFKEMLDESLADAMSSAGGVGIADVIQRQLDNASAPAPPRPMTARAYSLAPSALTTVPVDGPLTTSAFGRRSDPIAGDTRQHQGLDLAAPAGAPVRAAGAGVVRFAGEAGTYGNLVVVDHGGGLETRYAHLGSVGVQVGQSLAAGAQVGAVGATGRATGPHLHFEVRRGGQAIDPTMEFQASSSRPSGRPKDGR